ncbi:MAG TPA: NADH-quinone oxidoreductase subunit J [Planctomycetota bacterium]|nr:NADH-quinone oxidoreductase subunit J [Planctomycetota bacterium]
MATSEILINLVYYVVAAAALGGGVAVAVSKNIVRSAFALLTVLFSVAGVYALARADFIVAAQILIYVGGILVLIIFAIMLTHKITDVKLSNESSPGPVSVTACLSVFVLIVTAFVYGYSWKREAAPVRGSSDFALEGRPPVRADLSMWQGGGLTGVEFDGKVLDGFVRLKVKTSSSVKETVRAQFALSRVKKGGGWEDLPPSKPAPFATEGGAAVAWTEFERLEEGKYEWKARLVDEGVESPWVEFAQGQLPDFTSEKGLTKAIGRAFMGPYLLAFEVVSVLLLAALVGAAFLARKEVRE